MSKLLNRGTGGKISMFCQCDMLNLYKGNITSKRWWLTTESDIKQISHKSFIKQLKNNDYCTIHNLVFKQYDILKLKRYIILDTKLIINFLIVNYTYGSYTHVKNIFVFVINMYVQYCIKI